jgi:hypothetical protein
MLRHYHAGMQAITLLSPLIRSSVANDSNCLGNKALREASTAPGHNSDRSRLSAYVLVALAALFAGYVLDLLGGQPSNGSRVAWPSVPTNPRSFSP